MRATCAPILSPLCQFVGDSRSELVKLAHHLGAGKLLDFEQDGAQLLGEDGYDPAVPDGGAAFALAPAAVLWPVQLSGQDIPECFQSGQALALGCDLGDIGHDRFTFDPFSPEPPMIFVV